MNLVYAITCFFFCCAVVSKLYQDHIKYSSFLGYVSLNAEEDSEEEKIKRRKRDLVDRITYTAKDIVRDSNYKMPYQEAYQKAEEIILAETKIKFEPISGDIKEIAKLPIPKQPVQ